MQNSAYSIPQRFLEDKDQSKAIAIDSGRWLVLGAAGSGKTEVLSERVARALKLGADPSEMACITFTKKASSNMFDGITRETDASCLDGVFIGNIHTLCNNFLKQKGIISEDTGIIGSNDATVFLRCLCEDRRITLERDRILYDAIEHEHMIHQLRHKYPRHLLSKPQSYNRDELSSILKYNGLPVNSDGIVQLADSVESVLEARNYRSSSSEVLMTLLLSSLYSAYKKENNLIDFADMQYLAYDYLRSNPDEGGLFGWVQVDEAQDISSLQHEIIRQMCRPDCTTVYFADEQQAISSFLGVKTDVLRSLQESIGKSNTICLRTNYRSASAVLRAQNAIAKEIMDTPEDLLPEYCSAKEDKGHFAIRHYETVSDEYKGICSLLQEYTGIPDETSLVCVQNKYEGADICRELDNEGIPYMAILEDDIFRSPDVRFLLSHFAACTRKHDFLSWAIILDRILPGLKDNDKMRLLVKLRQNGASAADLLRTDGLSYLQQYKAALRGDVVFFDTETTGLNTEEDDIVQIAAIRLHSGKETARVNLLLETKKPIPAKLGDKPNPLVEEYKTGEHLSRKDALRQFMEFSKDAVLIAHNADFDYSILDSNLRRDCSDSTLRETHPQYLDTLTVARLVDPSRRSHKLESLIRAYGLEGVNSHLANDDIAATVKLSDKLMSMFSKMEKSHITFLSQLDKYAMQIRSVYSGIYEHTRAAQYNDSIRGTAFSTEIRYVYSEMLQAGLIEKIARIDQIIDYLSTVVLKEDSGYCLGTLLSEGIGAVLSAKESDILGSPVCRSRVVVSTPLKAKGLQFDHVIISHANEKTWPHYKSEDNYALAEDARKFYVCASRARTTLDILYRERNTTKYGKSIQADPSRFLGPLWKLSHI